MKFRKGGRAGRLRRIIVGGTPLEVVGKFPYLGIVFTSTGTHFGEHISDRIRKAHSAMTMIKTPQMLSLRTVLILFNLRVAPVASYGIQLIWPHLTAHQLGDLDKVKATFLKRALGLHKNSRNRLVYILCGSTTFIEELVTRFCLPETDALKIFRQRFAEKMRDVPEDFYSSAAMRNQFWKSPSTKTRHIITRYSVHGFHGSMCTTSTFHEPCESCICKFCNNQCPIYHHDTCTGAPSLSDLSKHQI